MSSFIQITRHLYEEPYTLNLVILASNGSASGSLEFYLSRDSLKELGEGLAGTPNHNRAVARFSKKSVFERGSERPEDNLAWYFRLRAFAVYRGEAAGIQLRMNNNQNFLSHGRRHSLDLPYNHQYISEQLHQLTDFTILTGFDRVKELGRLLIQFSKLKEQRLFWTPEGAGVVDNNLELKDRTCGDVLEAAYLSLPSNLASHIPDQYKTN